MFPSLSSCTPSALVTTSFTVKEKQTLVINQPVRVVGPNVYYVYSPGGGTYDFYTNQPALVFYQKPEIHCRIGITYLFVLYSLQNEPFYITTTAGTEYTAGIRYSDYDSRRQNFIWEQPGAIFSDPIIFDTVYSYNTAFNIGQIAVWIQPFGSAARSFLVFGVDYTAVKVGSTITFTFTPSLSNVTLYLVPGGMFNIGPPSLHPSGFRVQINGITLTPFVDYAVGAGNLLGIFGVYPSGSLVVVDFQAGMEGHVFFTPSATTPSTLQVRNRRTKTVEATIRITPNGTIYPLNSQINLKENDQVFCSIVAPATYLSYNYYEYFLGGKQNYFAVVTKNNYVPLIKTGDRLKRYFNYPNYNSSISIMEASNQEVLYVSLGGLGQGSITGDININNYHIVLDVVNYKVNFYTASGGLGYSVILPDFPIEYHRYNYTQAAEQKTDLVVLCANGTLYRINNKLKVTASSKFTPAVPSLAFLNANLPINEDIPFLGSFTDAARQKLVSSLFPVVTSFTLITDTTFAYMVGSNSLAKVNLSTGALFSTVSLSALGSDIKTVTFHDFKGVIVTTANHNIWYIWTGSNLNMTPIGGPFVLGTPCNAPFDLDGRTLIPDSHNRRLIVINGSNSADTCYINLGDFIPAYCKRFGDIVYVTGHDTNRVVKIKFVDKVQRIITELSTNAIEITYLDFSKKVTVVSGLGLSVLAHHYLDNRLILDFDTTPVRKIIPMGLDYREGPSSSIGTTPTIIKMLGVSAITPIPGPYIKWWVNGEIGAAVTDGAYLGVNYRGSAAGLHRSFIILGEHALDYDTKTIPAISYRDHFQSGVYGSNFLTTGTANYVPPISVEGDYTLPFSINYFGTTYTSFLFSASHGILSLDITFPLKGIVPSFAAAATDALIIEPRSIVVDNPIDNRNVSAVVYGSIIGGKTPGVYYTQGIVGEFAYYKWKAIGTTALPSPYGIIRNTEILLQTGTQINMADFSSVSVGDYVSNPITSPGPPYTTIISTGPVVGSPSCQVVAKIPYAASVNCYYAAGTQLYITIPASAYDRYAKITDSGGVSYDWSNATFTNTLKTGNIVLSVDANKITVEGLTNLYEIDKDKFIFELTTVATSVTYDRGTTAPYFTTVALSSSTTTVTDIVRATNIQHVADSFSPIEASTASNFIQVSKSIYDRLVVGQRLTSPLFGGPETIVGKSTVFQTFSLTVTPQLAWEGIPGLFPPSTVEIDLKVSPIPDGTYYLFTITGGKATIVGPNADFEGIWTVEWPASTRPPITVPSSNTISMPIYDGWIKLKLPVKQDLIPFTTEKLEDYFVTVTSITGPAASISIGYTTSTKLQIGNTRSNTGVSANPVIYQLYFIELTGTYSSSTSDVISSQATVITVSSVPATVQVGSVTNPITYFLPQPPPPAPAVEDPLDKETVVTYASTINYKTHVIETINNITVPINGVAKTLNLTGNFLQLSVSQTLPATTPMYFKPYVGHPVVEFEVAFYKGRNFQYIEFNYLPPPEHDRNLHVGIRNASGSYWYEFPGFSPLSVWSRLYGGDFSDGILYDLGPGQFNHIPSGGFVARTPRIYKTRVFDPTTARYDIYIDQKIPALVDLRASVDYGYLRLNDGLYDGTKKIQEGDILSVVVPYGPLNKTVSSVILSLAQNQFAIPIAPDPDLTAKTELSSTLLSNPIINNINISFVLGVTGRYMIPDYFSSAAGGGSEMIFERWVGGSFMAALDRGSYVDLFAGDEIRVNNIFTGYRNFNTVPLVFAGPVIQRVSIETVGRPDLVDYLDFGQLYEPFVNLKRQANVAILAPYTGFKVLPTSPENDVPQLVAGAPFNQTFGANLTETTPFYETRYLTLTTALGTTPTVDLFSDTSKVTFINNYTRTNLNSAVVAAGARIGLEWDVGSYWSSNSKIYQITTDSLDGSDIYTEVGKWDIKNKEISELWINGDQGSGRSIGRVQVLSGGSGYDRNNIFVDFDPPPPGGTKPTAFAVISLNGSGAVTQIVLTNGGSGYVNAPNVYLVGPNTGAALLVSYLVEGITPHETEIRIKPTAQEYRHLTSGATLPSKVMLYGNDFSSRLPTTLLPTQSILSKSTVAYKGTIEFNYITTPQPLYAVFKPETIFTSSLSYQFVTGPTFFTGISLNQIFSYNFFTKQLTFGNILTISMTSIKLENREKVLPQVTTLTPAMGNYTRTFPPNFFTSRSTFMAYKFTPISGRTPTPYVEKPFTIFGRSPNFERTIQASDLTNKQQSNLVIQSESLKFYLNNYKDVIQPYIITNEAASAEPLNYNLFNSEAADFDLDSYSMIDGFKVDAEYQNTQDYGKAVDYEFDFTNVFFAPTPDPDKNVFTVLLPKTPDGIKDDFTVLYPKTPDANKDEFTILLPSGSEPDVYMIPPAFVVALDEDYDQGSLLYSPPTSYYFGNPATQISDIFEVNFFENQVLSRSLDEEYATQDRLLLPLPPEWDTIERAEPPITPEWIYQDKIFTDITPEWIYQDKIFTDITPEWIYQDKIFTDITPEIPDPGNRYIDLTPILGDPGNRYFPIGYDLVFQDKMFVDLVPYIDDSGNRYLDFSPLYEPPTNIYLDFASQYEIPSNLYIDFPAQYELPANRYIDFIPKLIGDASPLLPLTPELLYQDKAFIELTSWRISEEKFFMEVNFKLDQLNVQYQDGYNLYGAFKTEFLIFADQGRGGDLGQYQGTPPGTPGRTNVPILPYTQFVGSALLKYSPTYGLGGFGTQAAAQAVADKYVNATAIQVPVVGFWNYRIHFDKKVFYPRKSRIFPTLWYVRGA